MPYLIAGGVVLAWAVFRMGSVLPADRFVSALAFAVVALALFLFARRAELAPRLSRWVLWPAVTLPAYAALQLVPLPVGVLRLVSPARAEQVDALGSMVAGVRYAPLSVMPSATLRQALTLAGCLLIFLVVRELA